MAKRLSCRATLAQIYSWFAKRYARSCSAISACVLCTALRLPARGTCHYCEPYQGSMGRVQHMYAHQSQIILHSTPLTMLLGCRLLFPIFLSHLCSGGNATAAKYIL